MSNPILARVQQLAESGLHPLAVRVSADGRGKWQTVITLDDMTSAEEAGNPNAPPIDRSKLPAGVKAFSSVRFPDDVSEVRGSAEAVETWIAEVARVGRAVDWARFEGDGDGYPAYLTKPSAWLRESNPFHPENPKNPANKKYKTFGARLTALRGSLSIPDLARKSGLSDDAIRRYESGDRSPTWEAVQKLAQALGVPTDTFRDQ